MNYRYKGKDTFNFNEVHVTEIKNLIKEKLRRFMIFRLELP